MSTCPTTGKVRYGQQGAQRALDEWAAKRLRPGQKRPVNAYRCRFCGSWHLTAQRMRRLGGTRRF